MQKKRAPASRLLTAPEPHHAACSLGGSQHKSTRPANASVSRSKSSLRRIRVRGTSRTASPSEEITIQRCCSCSRSAVAAGSSAEPAIATKMVSHAEFTRAARTSTSDSRSLTTITSLSQIRTGNECAMSLPWSLSSAARRQTRKFGKSFCTCSKTARFKTATLFCFLTGVSIGSSSAKSGQLRVDLKDQ